MGLLWELKNLIYNSKNVYLDYIWKYKKVKLYRSYTSERTICDDVPNKITTSRRANNKFISYIIPQLTSERVNEITTITGVSLGQCYISWLKFAIKPLFTVLEWNARPLPEEFRYPISEPKLLKMAHNVNHMLPDSDLYVMETFSIRGKKLIDKLNEFHLSSMLTVLLNGIHAEINWKDKVFFQKQIVINNLYDLLTGSERISSRMTVENILYEFSNSENTISPISKVDSRNYGTVLNSSIQIHQKYVNLFNKSTVEKKDDLAKAFLLTLSFIEVNIVRNQCSLSKLNKK